MSSHQIIAEPVLWSVREIRESSEELLALLDKKELYLPFLEQITAECRKKEWLTVRMLLKEMLGDEKEILYTATGKPYLADDSFQISISHTKGFVAIALHPQTKVGIDVEYISPRIQKIRHRFISKEEEENLDKEHEEIHLLLYWSAKESLFKILGEQDVDFKANLHIKPFKLTINKLSPFSAYETKTGERQAFYGYYLVDTEYVLTIIYS